MRICPPITTQILWRAHGRGKLLYPTSRGKWIPNRFRRSESKLPRTRFLLHFSNARRLCLGRRLERLAQIAKKEISSCLRRNLWNCLRRMEHVSIASLPEWRIMPSRCLVSLRLFDDGLAHRLYDRRILMNRMRNSRATHDLSNSISQKQR